MQKKLILLAALMLLASLFALKISAQTVNHSDMRFMSYQGIIKNHDGTFADGKHKITLTMYSDNSGKNAVWRADYDVDIWNGYFSIILGGFRKPLPDNTTMDQPLWVGVMMEGGDEMRPLTQLAAAPYALNVPDQSITMAKLAPDVLLQAGHNPTPQAATAFHEITGDTNTTATMTVGSGAVLRTSGTGTITANQYVGSGSTSNAVDLATAEVNGILPVANGGTGGSVVPWLGTGNSGTTPGTNYIGTSDSTAFEIHVNHGDTLANRGSKRVLRFETNATSPNIIGGYQKNYIYPSIVGSVIGGGGSVGNEDSLYSDFSVISGGSHNFIGTGNHNVIIGGDSNSISRNDSTGSVHAKHGIPQIQSAEIDLHDSRGNIIGSGGHNRIDGDEQNGNAIVAGYANEIWHSQRSFIGAGLQNKIGIEKTPRGDWGTQVGYSVLVGGFNNTVFDGLFESGFLGYTFLGGGESNTALMDHVFLGGGLSNTVSSSFSFVGGGQHNTIQTELDHDATDDIGGEKSAIVGGEWNQIYTQDCFIGGGNHNIVGILDLDLTNSNYSAIGGGDHNQIISFADHCFIGGGYTNIINGSGGPGPGFCVIAGGNGNNIVRNSTDGAIGGGTSNSIGDVSHSNDNSNSVICGGWGNKIESPLSIIGGGYFNLITTDNSDAPSSSAIAGGYGNHIFRKSANATIGGGVSNTIGNISGSLDYSSAVISGGFNNTAEASSSAIGGGYSNHTIGGLATRFSTICGGTANNASAFGATVAGGVNNNVTSFGQLAGGFYNEIHTMALSTQPYWAFTDALNGQLFMIGNGSDYAGRHNAFEVSYNGHAIVYDKNGSGATRASIRGGTYQDNVINAWGLVVAGAATQDFGIATVQHTSTGCYTIILNIIDPVNADNPTATQIQVTLSQAAITATNYYGNGSCVGVCNYLTVGPIGTIEYPVHSGIIRTKFTITITHLTSEEGHPPCDVVDGDFMLHVIGRQ